MTGCISLNPCIDRTIYLSELKVGGYNREKEHRDDVSGKGINVCVALGHLGMESVCAGLDFFEERSVLQPFLSRQDIPFAGVCVKAPLRVNMKLFDESASEMTEVNSSGAPVSRREVEELLAVIRQQLPQWDRMILSGSVPPGMPDDIYGQMIELAHEAGVPAVLDADGKLMKEGLKAAPDMIKPNRVELEHLLDRTVSTVGQAVEGAKALLNRGVTCVMVSLGGKGALLVTEKEAKYCAGVPISVKSFQGAGDSMVAGWCLAKQKDLPAEDQLRYGAAAAHASLILPGSLLCGEEEFHGFLKKLSVEDVTDEVAKIPL